MKNLTTTSLAALFLSACAAAPPADPVPGLTLSSSQQASLRTQMGLAPNNPFTVAVQDIDRDGLLSVGDIAVVFGGIANAEIRRRALTAADVSIINTTSVVKVVPAPVSDTQSKLRSAQAKWRLKQPTGYSYTLQRNCFCPPDHLKPVDIRVYNGLVQEATMRPFSVPLPPERRSEALAVEGLFALVQDAIDRNASTIVVNYEPYYGYPVNITVDYATNIADEELALTASNFRPQ
ncbi:MAG: hypothetical protein KJ914_12030 [Gammaproteobacteria bacterium]|nr:hypothetical protein [Gammaproteobacteria bacterium]MBU1722508.1 hypothetical protein [Gammaproteobacteria bacterium]MBU2007029.1 hypothetical protein [Gammaproteobacteria bacterium]